MVIGRIFFVDTEIAISNKLKFVLFFGVLDKWLDVASVYDCA